MKRMIVSESSPKESMDLIDIKNREKWIASILKSRHNDYTREDLEVLPMKALEDLYMNT